VVGFLFHAAKVALKYSIKFAGHYVGLGQVADAAADAIDGMSSAEKPAAPSSVIVQPVVVNVLPSEMVKGIARDLWEEWSRASDERGRRVEIERIAQMPGPEYRRQVEEAVAQTAGDQPASVKEALAAYLLQVPGAIHRSLRHPRDPGGRTMPPSATLRSSGDVEKLLPDRWSRFRPGFRPSGVGDWALEELLGVGGFGEVWKARGIYQASAAPVALKFCLDPQALGALKNEVHMLDRVMSRGRHPGIVQLQHTYLNAEHPCLQYEYVEGSELTKLMGQPQPPANAAGIVAKIAQIVAFAHQQQIVHRDLKPANILVRPRDDGGVSFHILDFGIGGIEVKQALDRRTRLTNQQECELSLAEAARGSYTPLYASPQQVDGENADPRDDVYALGVIWHQLLTGDLRSGAPTGTRWMRALEEKGMAKGLIELLAACLEKDRADRPADAGKLAEELKAKKQDEKAPVVIPEGDVPLLLPAAETKQPTVTERPMVTPPPLPGAALSPSRRMPRWVFWTMVIGAGFVALGFLVGLIVSASGGGLREWILATVGAVVLSAIIGMFVVVIPRGPKDWIIGAWEMVEQAGKIKRGVTIQFGRGGWFVVSAHGLADAQADDWAKSRSGTFRWNSPTTIQCMTEDGISNMTVDFTNKDEVQLSGRRMEPALFTRTGTYELSPLLPVQGAPPTHAESPLSAAGAPFAALLPSRRMPRWVLWTAVGGSAAVLLVGLVLLLVWALSGGPKDWIIGSWEVVEMDGKPASGWTMEFRRDGTYSVYTRALGHSKQIVPGQGRRSGTYRWVDDRTLEMTEGDSKESSTTHAAVAFIGKDEMRLTQRGSTYRYKRAGAVTAPAPDKKPE
jgi:serine/threonine protein kinase